MSLMLMMLAGPAAASQLPPPPIIVPHEHVSGPTPTRIVQTSEVVCPAGTLRVAVAQHLLDAPLGVRLNEVVVDGVPLGPDALRELRAAVGRFAALANVETGCF